MSDTSPTKPTVVTPAEIEGEVRNPYPPPHDTALNGKARRPIGDMLGLTKFGVNVTDLEPGAISALRHWHADEDEFVYIIEGAPTLVTEAGETQLAAGMAVGFPADNGDAHRLENRSDALVRFMEIGNRAETDTVIYPDDDMVMHRSDFGRARRFTRHDGTDI